MLAVVVGVIIAITHGGSIPKGAESALNGCSSASGAPSGGTGTPSGGTGTPSGGTGAPSGGTSPAPCPSGSTAPAPPPVNPEAGQADLAMASPVDPTGAAISLTQSAAEAANTLSCTLIVPKNPLTARGLATPWQLSDGCSQANPSEEAFVESTILAPNGQLRVYDPLVVTQGTTPAAQPAMPSVPRGATVVVDVGFNGNNLVLEGAGAKQGNCVDAFGNSIIAQTSACNSRAFFAAANQQIATRRLRIPALGTATDRKGCQSTESFQLIDQDQSDNVVAQYLITAGGQTAQATAANKAAMGDASVIANGSDDGLLAHFVDPALGCTPFMVPDATSMTMADSSQALNALSAQADQRGQRALLPVNDPQLLVAGQMSIGKTNTFRMLTDEPLLAANTDKNGNAATYCQDMVNLQPAQLRLDAAKEAPFTSPVPATGNNLATFMGARLAGSFDNMNCQNFGLTDPATVTTDANGVATAVSYTVAQQKAKVPGGDDGGSGGGHSGHGGYDKKVPPGRHRHHQNAAGM
jgi:hypothetical protein